MSNATIQVKPWSHDQGDFVIINEGDFDPDFHELLDGKVKKLSAPVDTSDKTALEVLAMASDPSVQFMSFKSAASKILGDKTPSKKDEIVAALEELATNPSS
jgi:hypothetical protein